VHPILTDPRRLGLYLLAWVPLGALLTSLLAATGSFHWGPAAELALPLTLIYAFLCLSAWYLCRFAPIGSSRIWHLLVWINPAAAIVSLIWSGAIGWALALALGLETEYLPQRPLLFGTGMMLYYLAAAFHYVLMAMQVSREAQQREMEAAMLARDAELRALKAQINPHFLFNSLNSISALTASDPALAREMCILLSDFLRSSLGMGERESIPLGEELALVRAFLAIQQVRFGARLQVEERLEPGAEACLVPPLLLQPLVENAITHGVATLVEGGWIRLEARCAAGELAIVVENTFDPEALRRRRTGVGLPNVRRRVAALYGEAGRVEVRECGGRFRVRVVLPAGTEENHEQSTRSDRG
jgi:two-component system, LytTR family, sensor histidine kinase AlgZ